MSTIAALAALIIAFVYPPLGAPAIIAAVNVFVWRRRLEIIRAERARARARAEERRYRELIEAARYFR
jgi:hypothetical protein